MWDTLDHAGGAGLAAVQVNIDLRIFIVDTGADSVPPIKKAFINPEIVWHSAHQEFDEEGCLSIPGLQVEVPRAAAVRLRYLNEQFVQEEEYFEGIAARIIQHEFDHTQGRLYLDRLKPLQVQMLRSRLERIRKGKLSCAYPLLEN